jgi:hypothetical protein
MHLFILTILIHKMLEYLSERRQCIVRNGVGCIACFANMSPLYSYFFPLRPIHPAIVYLIVSPPLISWLYRLTEIITETQALLLVATPIKCQLESPYQISNSWGH